ncbi:hypothetical protein OH76DRAFT_1097510 [Lentinus brumalis]|uniref:Uncharacterized protein n=1 Tax=Lentinus brumalis TaxID=2498619 RepID=A0A371CVS9_9APHY|nr:hypothetical protein OH76DRAFT_1097510 [Polyporus brumalis]
MSNVGRQYPLQPCLCPRYSPIAPQIPCLPGQPIKTTSLILAADFRCGIQRQRNLLKSSKVRYVPNGFLTLDEECGPLTIDGPREVLGLSGWNCRGVEWTREVSGGLSLGSPAGAGPTVSAGGGFKLTCKKTSGAILALAHDPISTYIESSARIASYMTRHHESWLEMANSQSSSGLGLGLALEDLYFVSGTMKVPQWFIGVFDRGEESESGAQLRTFST